MTRARLGMAIVATAAAYILTARIGFAIHAVHGVASLIWAPAGIALAAVLLLGRWAALGVVLGAMIALASRGAGPGGAVFLGAIVTVEALGGAYVLRRVLRFHAALDRVIDVIGLVVVAGTVTLLGSAIASCGLVVVDALQPEHLMKVWETMWWGHLSGDIVIAPLVLTWATRAPDVASHSRARVPEAIALGLLLIVVGAFVFNRLFPHLLPGSRLAYYVFPMLLWAGLRFGPRGASLCVFAISALAIGGAVYGLGPFRSLADLQSFVSVSAITTLTVGAVAVERRRAWQRKAAIQQAALDAIVTMDEHRRILEFNPAAERLFRVSAADAIGTDAAALMPEQLRDAFRRALATYIATGEGTFIGQRLRFPARRADDSEFRAEVAFAPVPIVGEHLFTGFVRDVTAEEQAEAARREAREALEQKVRERTAELVHANEELRRGEDMLREAQSLAQLGSFDADQELRLQWSDELFRLLGRDRKTFTPTPEAFLASVHPDDRPHVQANIERAMDTFGPFSFEHRIVRPDGDVRIVLNRGTVTRDAEGHIARITGYCQDITERKHAEEARYRLVDIVESSSDAIIGLSLDGAIESWNAAAERIFGYPAAEVTGHPATMLVPLDRGPDLERMLAAVRAGQRPGHYELVHRRRDGTVFDASVTTSAIADPSGRVIGLSQVLRDISAQKAAENQIRASLREKEVLLREIHHRVKNNLQVISSLLNLQLTTVPSEEGRQGLIESQSRIQSMALVHQLLYQSKDLARIDLVEYLRNLVQRLIKTYKVGAHPVETSVEGPSSRVDLDRAIPCGLIVNELVTNSLGHAFPGGRGGRIAVTVTREGDQLALEVHDDGVGVPPGIEIETAQSFGLMIARILTQQIEGHIVLHRDGGTTVRITFPEAVRGANAA